jgi:hypothetical protein
MDIEKLQSMIGEQINWIDYTDNHLTLSTESNKITIKTDNININKNNLKIQPRTPVHSLSEDFLADENYIVYFDVTTMSNVIDEKHYTCILNKEQLELFKQDTIQFELDHQIYYCKYNTYRRLVQSDIYFINSIYSNNIVNNLISELSCGVKHECDNIFNY